MSPHLFVNNWSFINHYKSTANKYFILCVGFFFSCFLDNASHMMVTGTKKPKRSRLTENYIKCYQLYSMESGNESRQSSFKCETSEDYSGFKRSSICCTLLLVADWYEKPHMTRAENGPIVRMISSGPLMIKASYFHSRLLGYRHNSSFSRAMHSYAYILYLFI